MGWEPRPIPRVTPETQRFWRAADEGSLLVRRCGDCGFVHHYPRSFCPDCFGSDLVWVECDGTGMVYTHTSILRVAEWPDETLPAVVGYVDLDEGPRIATCFVDCDPRDIAVGTPVRVRFVPTKEDEVAIPVFEPE